MSAQVATINSSSNSNSKLTKDEIDVNMLIKENEVLRAANKKLYRRTMNQRRKLLRLKRQIGDNDAKSEHENESEPANITDNVWEDVEEVMASYNIEK